uniref:Zf-C3Hc3H domain-containing protein n=1 Tax=Heterorhabditis bacteriophora TaxID=37862 RepID=A0A1I7XTE5_HETBA
MSSDVSVLRPPDQYIPAVGTSFCLVANEFDRNVYGECCYVGSRTLVKCRQIRRKDNLIKNGNQCEQHLDFRNSLKRRYTKEQMRLRLEGGHKKRKYKPLIRDENFVSEDDDCLMPCDDWSNPVVDHIFEHAPDDDDITPLRSAGVYTEKEVLRFKLAQLKKEIEALQLFKEMREESARRVAEVKLETLKSKKKCDYSFHATLDGVQQSLHAANASFGKHGMLSNRMEDMKNRAKGKVISDLRKCLHGRETGRLEKEVRSLLDLLISRVEAAELGIVDESMDLGSIMKDSQTDEIICNGAAIPASDYCIKHVMLDSRQCVFVSCEKCGVTTPDIDLKSKLCTKHRLIMLAASPRKALSPLAVQVQGGHAMTDLDFSSSRHPHHSSFIPFQLMPPVSDHRSPTPMKFTSIDSESEDEIERLNKILSHVKDESTSSRTSGNILLSVRSPSDMSLLSPSVAASLSRSRQRKNKEVETCRAARCRPFHPDFFPSNDETNRSPPVRTVTRQPPRTSLPFGPSPLPLSTTGTSLPMNPIPRQSVDSLTVAPQYKSPLPSSISRTRPQPPHRLLGKNGRPSTGLVASRVSQREVFMQRNQMEEDQKAAASIADSMDSLVEDRHTPPPSSDRMISGGRCTNQRGRGSSYPRPISRQRQPIQESHRYIPITAVESIRQNASGQFSTRTIITVGGIRQTPAQIARTPRMSASRTSPACLPTNLDLRSIPPEMNDAPLGEVLKDIAKQVSITMFFILLNIWCKTFCFQRMLSDPAISSVDSGVLTSVPLSSLSHFPPPSSQSLSQTTTRQRVPSILRKAGDHSSSNPTSIAPPHLSSSINTETRQQPPHRMMSTTYSASGVKQSQLPSHRMIKALPLPSIPKPRYVSKPITSQKPIESREPPRNEEENQPSSFNAKISPLEIAKNEEKTEEKSVSIELKPETTESSALDPLNILAAVSEAARGEVTKEEVIPEKRNTIEEDEEEEYEDEL